MAIDPVSGLIMLAAHGIQLYASFIEKSRTMTREEALAEWKKVQTAVITEDAEWEALNLDGSGQPNLPPHHES